MPYLIDGHNLIPHLGLSLELPDDELQLVCLLQEFCRLSRQQVEVYFDGAQAGQPSMKKFGAVTARFVRTPTPADDAIVARLRHLGRNARNWVLVTSDHRVQVEARSSGIRVITSPLFARQLRERFEQIESREGPQPEHMSEQDLLDWLKIFGATDK